MEFWVLLIKLLWKLHLYSFVEVYPHVLPEFSISNCRKLYFSKMPIMSICYSYIKIKELTSPSKVFPGGSAVPIQETQEMWVRSLSWEDHLEEEMATLSSILAWEIPWTEEPGVLQFMGSQRVGHD